ncbi:MAG: shikimate dehydrogenase [Planctomycetaceae bacterium]|nr:shikimate dehydrogenase [Planctomycetaceae bacterium]
MICVSIGRGRHKHLLAEHRHLVSEGAQLVELRLDYLKRNVNLQRILKNRPGPIVATCRRAQDGGRWEGTEESRLMILRSAIAGGVDYVDLEEDIAAAIPRYGSCQRIISLHDFRETPSNLEEIHQRLAALDADIVKIATMAHSPHDGLRMLRLVRDSEIPTVGICMGDIGTPSRILAGKFGAPFTYSTFHHERSLAPGQLSFQQMTDIYHYDKIDPETEIYGVMADPVGHSLSPIIHNQAFNELGLNKVYLPFRVPREDLRSFLLDCEELGIGGLSVTIPHKEDVISCIDEIDEATRKIGAVNTVIFRDGKKHGFNTDLPAAMASIEPMVQLRFGEASMKNRRALILGAGGVAKTIAYGLVQQGADVVICSRTQAKSELLASQLECDVIAWDQRHNVEADLLVNGTPVGMHPQVDQTPFEKRGLRREMVVFDTIYNPEQTLLVKLAREAGCATATGVDMFVRQAALQFEIFTDREAPIEMMRSQFKRTIGAARQ